MNDQWTVEKARKVVSGFYVHGGGSALSWALDRIEALENQATVVDEEFAAIQRESAERHARVRVLEEHKAKLIKLFEEECDERHICSQCLEWRWDDQFLFEDEDCTIVVQPALCSDCRSESCQTGF